MMKTTTTNPLSRLFSLFAILVARPWLIQDSDTSNLTMRMGGNRVEGRDLPRLRLLSHCSGNSPSPPSIAECRKTGAAAEMLRPDNFRRIVRMGDRNVLVSKLI